jgi:LuxR family transcriptional regulator, maltose regulon positive regulatory protein
MPRRSPRPKGVPGPLPHEVRRTGLLKRLTGSDLRLVMVTAPAGYGKTTLFAQAARESNALVVWLTCTEDDADPTTLLRSLVTSVRGVASRLNLSGWMGTVEVNATPLRQAQRLAEDLNGVSRNLWLVLDRSERLSPDAGRTLDGLFSHLGEGHRLLMAGYELPGVPVAQRLAQGDSLLLEAPDLAFSDQETKGYLRLRGSTVDAASVTNAVGGWPAGVALFTGTNGHGVPPEALIHEVLDRLPRACRRALPAASVLPVWSEAEAQRFALNLPRSWLQQARQAGLPLTPLGQGRYRPHTLLLNVLEPEFASFQDCQQLYYRVAEDLESRGEDLAAVRCFLAAGATQQALALTERLFPTLMRFDQRDVAESLIRSIPESERSTRVEVFFGWLNIVRGQNQEAADRLRGLYARGVRDGYLWWLLSMTEYVLGDFEAQVRLSAEGLALETDQAIRCLIYVPQVAGLQRLGRFEEGLTRAQEGYALAQSLQDNFLILRLSSVLLFALAEMQRIPEARIVARQNIALAERTGFLGRKRELCSIFADYCTAWGDFEEALALIQPFLNDSTEMIGDFLYVDGLGRYRTHIDMPGAVRSFEAALEYYKKRSNAYYANRILMWLADIDVLTGQLERAARRCEEAANVAVSLNASERGRHRFIEGRIWLARGDLARAKALLGDDPEGMVDQWDLARVRLYQAEIARLEGRLNRSLIDAIFQQLERRRHDGPLLTDHTALRALYEACAASGWYPERFSAALRIGSKPPVLADHRPVVRIRTFGGLEVTVNGTSVRMPLTKSGELLVWLVMHGPASREVLVDVLFGEARGSQNVEYFKVAVRRLRAALVPHLDADPVVFGDGVYRLSDMLRVECDAVEFFHGVTPRSAESVLDWLRSTKGEFLAKSDSEWVFEVRRRRLETLVRVTLAAARELEAHDGEASERLYGAAAALDPWLEVTRGSSQGHRVA